MSTQPRYFGIVIPLTVISTFVTGFIALTLYTHSASFTGISAESLRQGGLLAFGITGISLITILLLRRKSTLRTLFGTVIEAIKAFMIYVAGDQFNSITNYNTLDWTKITVFIPIIAIISLYIPASRLESVGKRRWGRRLITAMPSMLFILLLLTGYIVELGKTRHHEIEPAPENISAQYFESGFKVGFWKGIQLDAPDDVVFTIDPTPRTIADRLWRIQVWDRYTTQEWQKSLQQTEDLFDNPFGWPDPIPTEQDSVVNLIDDPTTYDITIPIYHGGIAPLKYQDYLPTGWWDSETYGTYIRPNSFGLESDVSNEEISFNVELEYSTYQRGILFHDEGLSNLTYEIETYPYDAMWPARASILMPEDIDESILPRMNSYLQLPRDYPDPSQHPLTLGNATRLKDEADDLNLNTYARAVRINDFIANNFGFDNESFFGSESAEEQPEATDMVEWFLSNGKGTHTHFASTMAVLLRYQGIPCRVVRGYAQGDDVGDITMVRQKHVMVWVEVFVPYESEGAPKGKWRPFFPILPLGVSQEYLVVVWPGTDTLQEMFARSQLGESLFTAGTDELFQLNAFVANNATNPPNPVMDVSVNFINFQTGESLGEALTDQDGIATIQTAYSEDDPHGLVTLGALVQNSPASPSVYPTVHRKYQILWLIEPPAIVIQGQSYPLSVQLIQTIDNSGLGPGISINFIDNLYIRGGELHATPTQYTSLTDGNSIAQVNFQIPDTVEYPLGNHTVLAEFTIEDDIVNGFSTPFYAVGTVVIQPAAKASLSISQHPHTIQDIDIHQEPMVHEVEAILLPSLDVIKKFISI